MRTNTLYGIRLRNGQLAIRDRGYATYFKYRDAVDFRNALTPHIGFKGKIVRIRFEWEDGK